MTPLEEKLEGKPFLPGTLFRLVGYGLLLLTLFDVIETFIPPKVGDPIWRFDTIGNLVERVPVPLLSLMLIFYGERYGRKKREALLLKLLSWLTLLVSVLFLLLIPIGLTSPIAVSDRNNTRIDNEISQSTAQIQQFQDELSKTSGSELAVFFQRNNIQVPPGNLISLEEVKRQVLANSEQVEQNIKAEAEARRRQLRIALMKSSVKWNLGALVSSVLFLRIWRDTSWARQGSKRKQSLR
jgi:hypothetical protein